MVLDESEAVCLQAMEYVSVQLQEASQGNDAVSKLFDHKKTAGVSLDTCTEAERV